MLNLETVKLAIAGDKQAWNTLFAEHYDAVVFAAQRKLKNKADAEDVAQDVFLKGSTKIGQLREPSAFPGWIRRITQRLAINRLVKGREFTGVEESVLERSEEQAGESVDLSRIREAVAKLPEHEREIVGAHYFDGASVKQLAAKHNLPLGTVKRRLFDGRENLRRVLAVV